VPDPRFYRRAGPHQLAYVAKIAGAEFGPGINPSNLIEDVAPLARAGKSAVSFATADFADDFARAACGACLVTVALAPRAPSSCVPLICPDPRYAFAAVARAFYPPRTQSVLISGARAADAVVAPDAVIEHGAIIASGASIGPGCRIGANAVVGPGVEIGRDCSIGANVVLGYCIIGDNVVIHPGTVIGQAGFGFAAGPRGATRIPQLGRVLIRDHVELGANCTVDRGAFDDTIIGVGTKTDNMVHIGHSVVLGANCIVVAQSGIAGSTTIGDGVIIGGQVAISDHLTIGAGARIASKSGVMRDVGPGETVMGYPAKPVKKFWREVATLARLTRKSAP
jgi:UDP-3-O-[3-hydroxymyristoyl] glucosamine N-acyltransferase